MPGLSATLAEDRSISLDTRCGARSAIACATKLPIEWPTIVASGTPIRSIILSTSLAKSPMR